MTLPKKITIDKHGLLFDGRRLDYYLAADDPIVVTTTEACSEVRVTLLAAAVEIDPSLTVESVGDALEVTYPHEAAVA